MSEKWIVIAPKHGSWAKCHGLFSDYEAAIAWLKKNQFVPADCGIHPVNPACDCWMHEQQVCDFCQGPSGPDRDPKVTR